MKQKNVGWRLDYVLASRSLGDQSLACSVARDYGTSDHAPVTATFDLEVPFGLESEAGLRPPPVGRSQMSLFGNLS